MCAYTQRIKRLNRSVEEYQHHVMVMFLRFLISKYFSVFAKISGLNIKYKLFQKLNCNNE